MKKNGLLFLFIFLGVLGNLAFAEKVKDNASNSNKAAAIVSVIMGYLLDAPLSKPISRYKKIAVVSTNVNERFVSLLENTFDTVIRTKNNQWAEYTLKLPFEGRLFIDLGGNSDDDNHINPYSMQHLWWYRDYGYLQIHFKDKNKDIIHSFAYKKYGSHWSAYIEFDGDQHNASSASYTSDIFGYIVVSNGKFDFQGENHGSDKNKNRGISPKIWEMDNYEKINSVEIKIGTVSTYSAGISVIPLYISTHESNSVNKFTDNSKTYLFDPDGKH